MDHRRTDDHAQHDELDRDLNVRGIAWTVAGLVALVIAAYLVIWSLLVGFDRLEDRRDPAPLPLPAASRPPVPPEPRLQPSPEHDVIPEQDLRQVRDEEDEALSTPEWIDESQGTLRIPIEAAIDLLAERGLPATERGLPATEQALPAAGAGPAPNAPNTPNAAGQQPAGQDAASGGQR